MMAATKLKEWEKPFAPEFAPTIEAMFAGDGEELPWDEKCPNCGEMVPADFIRDGNCPKCMEGTR